ncbi:hypothetical protein HG717_32230 [Rhodococcus erythropolis]|uniref:hypothetical protein n=1 Tax=Rhodococcus erythropolis TaxID=1833 RepID=UPI001C9AC31C|nr:hypothetical protein [Rhodococcus erythropolis]MBY6388552.1 hypothetical protein [Rhodococcus erythropolis]
MAKKNDFTKRANEFLSTRLGPVQRLGELLDTKAEKEAELQDIEASIEKAALECIEAGWKPAELTNLGVPRTAIPRRQPRNAALEPRTPDNDPKTNSSDGEGNGAEGGSAPEPSL